MIIKKIKPIYISFLIFLLTVCWFLFTAPITPDSPSLNQRERIIQSDVMLSSLATRNFSVEEIQLYYKRYARTQPNEVHIVKSEVAGVIESINVKEGDYVEKGDVLSTFELRSLLSEKTAIYASLSEKRSFYESQKRLRDQGHLNERALEQSLFELKKAESDLDRIKNQIAQHTIVSPVSGYITNKTITLGESIGANQQLFRIDDISKFKINTYIPENIINRISKNYAYAEFDDKRFDLTLSYQNPIASENRPLFNIEWQSNKPIDRVGGSVTLYVPLEKINGIKISPYIITIQDQQLGIKYLKLTSNENIYEVKFVPIQIMDTYPDNDVLISFLDQVPATIKVVTLGSDRIISGDKVIKE